MSTSQSPEFVTMLGYVTKGNYDGSSADLQIEGEGSWIIQVGPMESQESFKVGRKSEERTERWPWEKDLAGRGWLWRRRNGAASQGVGVASRSWKKQGNGLCPQVSRKKGSPADVLILAQ